MLHSELTIHSHSCHLGEDGFQILRAADLSKIDYIITVYNQGFDVSELARILKEQTEPLQLNRKADSEMEAENEKIEETSVLEHTAQCKDNKCREKGCNKTKREINHNKQCKRKSNGECPRCKKLFENVNSHANLCSKGKCSVPFCANIRFKKQQLQ